MDRTGLSDASTSRIISILGKWGNRGTEALGLVEVSPGKDDLRTKACRVSAAGRRLLERMNAVMSKGER
jgi:DNA-binding MarR family transcriptional regulator